LLIYIINALININEILINLKNFN